MFTRIFYLLSDTGYPPASAGGESKTPSLHPSEWSPTGTPLLNTGVTTLQTVTTLERFHVWRNQPQENSDEYSHDTESPFSLVTSQLRWIFSIHRDDPWTPHSRH